MRGANVSWNPSPHGSSPVIFSTLLLYSSDTRPILWLGIGMCAGFYLFVHGFFLLRRRHLILDTPASKIRSASMGMVEISGLAVGPYTMSAPITTRSCYYYRTLVWEWKRRGRSSQWVKVAAEGMHLPFFLDDNTGRVLVNPRGAELDLHCDFEQQFCDSFFTTKDPVPDNVRSFLGRHGIDTNSKIKVEEFCIKPKNALFVLGTLAENPGLEVSPVPIADPEATGVSAGGVLSSVLGGTSFSFSAGTDNSCDDSVPGGERDGCAIPYFPGSGHSPFARREFSQLRRHDAAAKDRGGAHESGHHQSGRVGCRGSRESCNPGHCGARHGRRQPERSNSGKRHPRQLRGAPAGGPDEGHE